MDVKTTFREPQLPQGSNTLPAIVFNEMEKSCINCHTTRTPLWRGGPAGPKSLCNACGIRYRKAKRALLGFDKQIAKKCRRKTSKGAGKLGVKLKMGGKMLLQRSVGEEEQAALLLMALSCGFVYA